MSRGRIKEAVRMEWKAWQGLAYHWPHRLLNSRRQPRELYWFQNKDIRNFGDEFSAVAIRKLFGFRVVRKEMWECDLLAVGSILNYAEEVGGGKKKVWGSGFIKEGGEDKLVKDFDYYAVRGEVTARRLGLKEVVLGDPGILADVVFPASKEKNGKIGLVAHYVDLELPVVKKILKDKRFVLINPLNEVAEVARQISACDYVISSSLHGLIFADSYGVPNAHVQFSDKVVGGDYKFEDYASGVGKRIVKLSVEEVLAGDVTEKIAREYEPIKNKRVLQRRLVACFPYKKKLL